jgi:hypothetical protein
MRTLSIIAFCLISAQSALAQFPDDSAKFKPVQVSFIYPIGLYGNGSIHQKNYLSFNIIYGVNGGLTGFELGGIANKNLGNVSGIQIAGISNNNLGTVNGIMIGGLINQVADSAYCVGIAGLTNRYGKSGGGLQIAGLSNNVDGNFTGLQAAGLRNKAKGTFNGLQISGLTNYNQGKFYGMQISGISNINSGNFSGMQIGLINRASMIGGMQIGLINIAKKYEYGMPIGLLSIVSEGFNALDLSYNETIKYNASLKLGVDHFYNIFKFGYMPNTNGERFAYGIGAGSMVSLTNYFKISVDLSTSYITEKYFKPSINFLTEGQLNLRYHLFNTIALFAGTSFNLYVSEFDDAGQTLLNIPKPLYDENWWYNGGKTQFWIGYNLGVSVMF